jgi:hypothetical protein
MWKAILAGTAALAIAGTSFVYAQQRHDGPARWRHHGADRPVNRGPSQEDRAAFTDARIAALKAGLRLTAEQEKLWPNFEAALREIAKSRMDRRLARQSEPAPADPVERLRRQADALSTAGAGLKRLADAQEPLYKSLDDSQKNRFQVLSRMLAPRHMRFAERGGRDWRGGRHYDHGQHGPRGHDSGPGYRL